MKVLVLGNLGYVGPVLTEHFGSVSAIKSVVGFDASWFPFGSQDTFLKNISLGIDHQIIRDIRTLELKDFDGVAAVVALAAVSNDPIGKSFEKATKEINVKATQDAALLASQAGVTRFVFASSCSVYGAGGEKDVDETAPVNPLTEYARSKLAVEEFLQTADLGSMKSVALRFGTACGFSMNMRLDLVLNEFVFSAIKSGKIKILSNGQPWRPMIHVQDMARAICGALEIATAKQCEIFNVGLSGGNWRVVELAEAVKSILPNVEIEINEGAAYDDRSYRVNFDKFENTFGSSFLKFGLNDMVQELVAGFGENSEGLPPDSHTIRLSRLNDLIEKGQLNRRLL